MEKKLLFEEGNYSIWRYNGIPDEALDFLGSIAWGNEGAVYEHKNTEEHIRSLQQPTLIAIQEGEKIQGTAVFCHTPVGAGSATYNCYYIRCFASSKEIRGKGVIKHFSIKVMETIRQDESEKTVFFACIEKGNKPSYRAVESAGYTNIGTMKTNGFSRFFPKAHKNLEQVKTEAGRLEVMSLLRQQYSQHALVQFDSIFMHDDYFVIRENGEIIAGCQFHRVYWVINRMPGFTGKIIMKVVPKIPLLNKIFNPNRFEFLAFEGIYFKPGHENRLNELFEGLLAKEKLNSGMYWMSENCPVLKKIQQHIKTGLIHSFVKDSDIFILAAFHDLDETEIDNFRQLPLFASAFDYV